MSTLLIIDDSKSIRNLAANILKEEWKVFVAGDWAAANPVLFREEIDIVLMDVEMPGVKGDTIAKTIKETALHRQPPKILLFSSLPEDELKERSERAGLDGYIHKDDLGQKLLEKLAPYRKESV